MNWENLGSSARTTFKNQNLFVNWEQQKKVRILHLWMNWENLSPNLSFTVESKIGNLHKVRLFTFQT